MIAPLPPSPSKLFLTSVVSSIAFARYAINNEVSAVVMIQLTLCRDSTYTFLTLLFYQLCSFIPSLVSVEGDKRIGELDSLDLDEFWRRHGEPSELDSIDLDEFFKNHGDLRKEGGGETCRLEPHLPSVQLKKSVRKFWARGVRLCANFCHGVSDLLQNRSKTMQMTDWECVPGGSGGSA